MRITDTMTSRKMELPPGTRIRIYLCGVTVYDDSHIGHARTIVVFDVLRRYLEARGCGVDMVQNFTDVDDKIIDRSAREGGTPAEVGERYIKSYHRDFDSLHVRRATAYPRATEHIPDMVSLIGSLVQKGAAYVTRNGVYFAVTGFPGYGKLSKKRTGELRSGARIGVDEDKRDPLDFALWKFSDSEPRWDSPWGGGRPGWHIECSAMSLKYLGGGIDIHGGGRDLIFPHHENEIAQSEAHTGRPFASIWMHVGMVTINGEKMSKSLGNVRSVRHVLDNWGPNVTRLFCLSGHYSKPVDYSEGLLRESLTKWRQVETAYYELVCAPDRWDSEGMRGMFRECREEFDGALEDDFNTHLALSAFFRLVREINRMAADGQELEEEVVVEKHMEQRRRQPADVSEAARSNMEYFMDVLGLYIPKITDEEIESINGMIAEREQLRGARQYLEADRIRDRIAESNIEILDHKSGTSWVKKERIRSDQAG